MSVPPPRVSPSRNPLTRAADSFKPSGLPAVVRRNYARELPASALLALGRAAFEGSVIAGVARVAYEGRVEDTLLNFAVAAIAAAPAAANILNFLWVRLAHGLNKTVFLAAVQAGVVACIIGLAAMPVSPAGLMGTIALVFVAWTCWSGFTAVRTTVWRANYPREVRASIASKFAAIQTLILGVSGISVGWVMDLEILATWGIEPTTVFRVYLLSCAVFAALSVGVMSGIRVRQHKRLLRAEREASADNTGPTVNPIGVIALLLEDKRYGVYQLNQFLLGLGNLMLFPLMPIMLRERFDAGYDTIILLSGSLGLVVTPLALPIWAKLLDGFHIVRFRAFHSWLFVINFMLLIVAVALQLKELLYVVVAIKGVTMAGGVLAWQLGHHDFAPASRASEYMGVHVTLTGVRGIVGPVAAVWLYTELTGINPELGTVVLGVCLVLVTLAAIGFTWMNAAMDLTPVDDRPPANSKTQGAAPVSRAES